MCIEQPAGNQACTSEIARSERHRLLSWSRYRTQEASMVAPAIALFFGLMVIVIAIRANVVLRQVDMVPMQWGLR
ncbi:MAG: hypothetical protein IM648_09715 [Phenylobacterium sp.]|nr:hypothetical protein [Phenylobacterium sp.]